MSGLTFPAGGLIAWLVSRNLDTSFLIPFAAGECLYIGAVDLVPEFKNTCGGKPNVRGGIVWIVGLSIMLAVRVLAE